jgi:hypothetical protein
MVEISIRRFFTSEDADVTPRITVVVPLHTLSDAKTDWAGLANKVAEQIAGLPIEGMREMTPAEVSNYRAEEGNE